jgi:hypothetical protein
MEARKMTQFRLGIDENQAAEVSTAFEAARVLKGQETEFQGKAWKGHALVFVCETFNKNIQKSVWKCIEAQEKAVEEAEKKGPLSGKDESRIRRRLRDKWFKEQSSEPEIQTRTDDNGRLFEASLLAGARYLAQCQRKGEDRDDLTFYPLDDYGRAYKQWDSKGGYLLRMRGDGRTFTDKGARPVLWLWMSTDIDIPFAEEYARLFQELRNPTVEISEVIPQEGADWEPPGIASGRVKAKG